MKQGRAAVAVGVLLVLVSTCLAVSPGFRTVFTNKGLDYSKQFVLLANWCILMVLNALCRELPDQAIDVEYALAVSCIQLNYIRTAVVIWLNVRCSYCN